MQREKVTREASSEATGFDPSSFDPCTQACYFGAKREAQQPSERPSEKRQASIRAASVLAAAMKTAETEAAMKKGPEKEEPPAKKIAITLRMPCSYLGTMTL